MFDGVSPPTSRAGFLLRLRRRGLLAAASRRTPGDALEPEIVQALERIARSSGPLLRLPDGIEQQYQEEWRITANHVRVLLAVLPILIFAGLALTPAGALGMGPEIKELLRALSLSLILPMALIAVLVAWAWPQRPLSGAIIAFGGLVIVLSLEVLRARGAEQGYALDHGLTIAVPVALSVLGGFRFVRVLGMHACYVLVLVSGEQLDLTPARGTVTWIGEGVMLLIAAMAALWMETSQRRSWAARRLLQLQAHQDPLTGLRNRRAFELHFELAAAQARRDRAPMLFALADLDFFKRVNDRYGHEYGDGALSEVAVVLSQFARRPLDIAARLGGEEFAILLYGCDADAAAERLQALVDQVRALGIDNDDAPLHKLTISAGGVIADGNQSLSELYRGADEHLYGVKRGGRNASRVGPLPASVLGVP